MDAPKMIGLVGNGLGGWRLWTKDEIGMGGFNCPDVTYVTNEDYSALAAEHDRLMAEKDAEIAQLRAKVSATRNAALEDAAKCCDDEADKCDDAVIWGGDPKYIAKCRAASYAMRNRAAFIRAMKGE